MSRAVKAAAAFLWCYSVLLLVETVGMGVARDWSDHGHLVQHVLVALAYSGLGWAVLHRQRWAWWVVVIVVGLISVIGIGAAAVFVFEPEAQPSGLGQGFVELFQMGRSAYPLFVVSVLVLAGSVLCLLTRGARDAFFRAGDS